MTLYLEWVHFNPQRVDLTRIKHWKQPKRSSAEQINKTQSVHSMDYHADMQRTICHYPHNMDESQKNIMLSGRSQTQNSIYCMILFIWISRTIEIDLCWYKSKGSQGHEGTFQGDGYVLYLGCGGCYIRMYNCQTSSNWILKSCAFYCI